MIRGAWAAILLLPLSLVPLSCSRGVTARESTASAPKDVDLLPGPCPSFAIPAGILPTQIPQFVSLWPRDGHRVVEGRCESVHRRTIVDHSGLLLSLSLVVSEGPAAPESLGFRAGKGQAPAVIRAAPDPGRATLVVELAAAPGTSEESLRSDLELVLERLRPPATPQPSGPSVGAGAQGASAAAAGPAPVGAATGSSSGGVPSVGGSAPR